MKKVLIILSSFLSFVLASCDSGKESYTAEYRVDCNHCDITYSEPSGKLIKLEGVDGPWEKSLSFTTDNDDGASLLLAAYYLSHESDFRIDTIRVSITVNSEQRATKTDIGYIAKSTVLVTLP